MSPRTEECVAVVGDCIAKEVSLVSAKQVCFSASTFWVCVEMIIILFIILKVVVGRNGLPVAMSPLVATLIESLVDRSPHMNCTLSNMDHKLYQPL